MKEVKQTMNQNILDMIDEIEMQSIYAEMEVCCELLANLEKQAVIIEHATNIEDFEFFMEYTDKSGDKQAKRKAEKEAKQAKRAEQSQSAVTNSSAKPETPEQPAGEEKGGKFKQMADAINAGVKDLPPVEMGDPIKNPLKDKEEEGKKIKYAWLKKFGIYIKKALTAFGRLIRKWATNAIRNGYIEFFQKKENAAKVPTDVKIWFRNGLLSVSLIVYILDLMTQAPRYKELYNFMIAKVTPVVERTKKDKFNHWFEVKDVSGFNQIHGTPFKYKEELTKIEEKVDSVSGDMTGMIKEFADLYKDANRLNLKLDMYKLEEITCTSKEFKKMMKLTMDLYDYFVAFIYTWCRMIGELKKMIEKGHTVTLKMLISQYLNHEGQLKSEDMGITDDETTSDGDTQDQSQAEQTPEAQPEAGSKQPTVQPTVAPVN